MPSVLDDPGKIIIMAGDFPTTTKKKQQQRTHIPIGCSNYINIHLFIFMINQFSATFEFYK